MTFRREGKNSVPISKGEVELLVEERLAIEASRVGLLLSEVTAKHVLIPEPSLVSAYLTKDTDLSEVLMIACDAVTAKFTDDTQFSLEVYRDPEIVDEYLALYVRQSVYADDILCRLREVYAAYASRLTDGSGWLQVTTDFAPPAG